MKFFSLFLFAVSTPTLALAAEINLAELAHKYFPQFHGPEITFQSQNSLCQLKISSPAANTIRLEISQGAFNEQFVNDVVLKQGSELYEQEGRRNDEGTYVYTSFYGNEDTTTLTKGYSFYSHRLDPSDRQDVLLREQKVTFTQTPDGVHVMFAVRTANSSKLAVCLF